MPPIEARKGQLAGATRPSPRQERTSGGGRSGSAAAPRGRPRSEAAHAAILDAALALMREGGYEAVTIEGVAMRAGVGKQTVYRRWSSREALLADAVGRLVSEIRIPDTGSTEGDLLALMRAAIRLYRDPANAALMPGLVAAMARSPRIANAVRGGVLAGRREGIGEVLDRAIARGDLRHDLDRELALDVLGGPLFYRLLVTGRPIGDRLARGVVDLLLRGFAPRAP
jgi:AcrR family transcriptional regulator